MQMYSKVIFLNRNVELSQRIQTIQKKNPEPNKTLRWFLFAYQEVSLILFVESNKNTA